MSPTPGDFILLEIICTYFPDGVAKEELLRFLDERPDLVSRIEAADKRTSND